MRVVDVYVPNGRAVGHEHYQYKLAWLDRLRRHLARRRGPDAPWSSAATSTSPPRTATSGTRQVRRRDPRQPARARGAWRRCEDWGLIDVFRRRWPDDGRLYSWWDYRAGDFHQGRGLRIDLVLATEPVADRVTWCVIDRNARKGTLPSDHAPLVVDLAATPRG